MKTIHKYPLFISERSVISMPAGAKILTVQMQGVYPHMWALVDPSASPTQRYISVYGTGHTVPDNPGHYIGTIQDQFGMVWHAFDQGEQ